MKRKHNPDITEAEVATAEKEFSDLRDAYEVLVDDGKWRFPILPLIQEY